ncbi:28S rRNA (cytosine-C(5))-methyltransferase isoform X1 [Phoenix dactylifera]|uniref:28S rRNA (Cytosine-C(5))-methyltransferase isoform X1 n=1 Tax=Phoenix dactylifera TaxID=42345 RepID=A0A8B7C791_PHODC|nr:28S rRNA (cytosine-C(5))-methyltransferase isoform X1 [Phoenix dactylifera]
MVRPPRPPPPPKDKKHPKRRMNSKKAVERSAYFARREAAWVLRQVLQGDARRRATASIKSLVYGPSVRNKKATFALVCQTLKYLPLMKDVLTRTKLLTCKWKKQEELIFVTAYDVLFGRDIAMTGDVEKFLMRHKDALQAALAQLCSTQKFKHVEDLLLKNQNPVISKPRYVRVNTLKMDVESAIQEIGKTNKVAKDDMVPDMLVLPSGVDLHDHPLVKNGSMFLQGKASSMVAVALCPKPGWKVLDGCAAPGNKTIHLAALMKGKGNIIACELHEERVKVLQDTIRRSGAPNVDIVHGDFLDIDTRDPLFAKVRAILLDPSCSGSGISAERLDHLLPSFSKGHDVDAATSQRAKKLAAFQRKALAHALSFPEVERVVYSTCSIYQTENEDVIKSVLPLATSLNFELATPFPRWPRRGLPVFEGCKYSQSQAEHVLRTDPREDMEGFFIALFVRKKSINSSGKMIRRNIGESSSCSTPKNHRKRKRVMMYPFCRMLRMWSYQALARQIPTER